MIHHDTELQVTQERIQRFERFLAEARKTSSPAIYHALAEEYLMEIEKMQAEIREYLSRLPEPVEAA
jgi:D-serine dehydratase